MAKDERAVVKLSKDTHEAIKDLIAYLARNGWASVGVERDDPPSIGTVIEEAVRALSARRKKSKGER